MARNLMARVLRYLKPACHVILFIFLTFILNKPTVKPIKNVERFVKDMRHLLLWTELPGLEEEGQNIFIKEKCQYKNCYITSNRNLLGDTRYFDGIIFNVVDVANQDTDLPRQRSKLQKYIFAGRDSADKYPVCSDVYVNFFNWTWTYRIDSSIPFKMLSVYNHQNENLGDNIHWLFKEHMKPVSNYFKMSLQTKTKAAAIFLDSCNSNSQRELFLKKLQIELKKYNHTVDVLGKCGTLKCDKINIEAFYYKVKTTYYFYLALENSVALDYVTDSVLYGFNNNAIPVVYGGAQYNRFLPPNSYLDATQLGVSKLASTMTEIIQDKDKYYDFFRWKNHYVIKKSLGMNICKLCSYMNNPKWLKIISYYGDFRLWWNSEYKRLCGP